MHTRRKRPSRGSFSSPEACTFTWSRRRINPSYRYMTRRVARLSSSTGRSMEIGRHHRIKNRKANSTKPSQSAANSKGSCHRNAREVKPPHPKQIPKAPKIARAKMQFISTAYSSRLGFPTRAGKIIL